MYECNLAQFSALQRVQQLNIPNEQIFNTVA